jgi:hypothetical protein
MDGRRRSPADSCEMIDKVTVDDVKKIARKLYNTPPCVISYGNVENVPNYNEIQLYLSKSYK